MKTQSALPWFGSDSNVAEDLAAKLDGCSHVTIPFVGGAGILPYLKARAIVANDLHCDAINFYKVLSGAQVDREALIDRCEHTLSHPRELEAAAAIMQGDHCATDRAWAFWALCWIGRKGKGGTRHQGGMPSIRRTAGGGTNASRITSAADDLHEWADHFKRCEWESRCFREVLPDVADRVDCGLYLDPPWVKAGRNYLHSFAEQDHRDLAQMLKRFMNTKIVLRYDDCELVRELYGADQLWKITEASSISQARTVINELWIESICGRSSQV